MKYTYFLWILLGILFTVTLVASASAPAPAKVDTSKIKPAGGKNSTATSDESGEPCSAGDTACESARGFRRSQKKKKSRFGK